LSLLVTALALLSAYLLIRQIAGRRVIDELLEACRAGKPVLPGAGNWFRSRRLEELAQAFNRLIIDKAAISDSGQKQFDQIRTTLENLREAVVMVDGDKVIRLANPAFNQLAAITTDPLGKRMDLFLAGPEFLEFLASTEAAVEGKRAELKVQLGGKSRWLEVSMAPLPKETYPDSRYRLFVFHDITRQKGLEKMRTEFIANVSHELRTPVTVIKGFAETLREDDAILSAAEKQRFLDKIHRHSERLHGLLQDLLLLSRLESTEMVLQKEPLSLSTFLSESSETWEAITEESGRPLIQEYAEGDDRILADPLRLTQVVSNLLQNSVHHATGFTRIRIKTRLEADGVHLIVEDDGQGIPEKDLPNIFQRFYRVDKGRSRESGGTGLGLAIVKHIVVQHKGEIRAESRKGQGTMIEICFPYLDRPGTAPDQVTADRPA
jgi:PAS domain S-box-containing protein